MKVCVAQTRPVTADIQRNIEHHKRLIDTAVPHHPDLIIFPELSLTGYEPNDKDEGILIFDTDTQEVIAY
jgi:predicted amidohydrolase